MRELDYTKIGMRIRQARREKGWSQDALAKKSGISMSFLGHIERGTRIMSLGTFVSICCALDADADGLLWGSVYPPHAAPDMPDSSGRAQDSYSMYVRIMQSVAEIMNDPSV